MPQEKVLRKDYSHGEEKEGGREEGWTEWCGWCGVVCEGGTPTEPDVAEMLANSLLVLFDFA